MVNINCIVPIADLEIGLWISDVLYSIASNFGRHSVWLTQIFYVFYYSLIYYNLTVILGAGGRKHKSLVLLPKIRNILQFFFTLLFLVVYCLLFFFYSLCYHICISCCKKCRSAVLLFRSVFCLFPPPYTHCVDLT